MEETWCRGDGYYDAEAAGRRLVLLSLLASASALGGILGVDGDGFGGGLSGGSCGREELWYDPLGVRPSAS